MQFVKYVLHVTLIELIASLTVDRFAFAFESFTIYVSIFLTAYKFLAFLRFVKSVTLCICFGYVFEAQFVKCVLSGHPN